MLRLTSTFWLKSTHECFWCAFIRKVTNIFFLYFSLIFNKQAQGISYHPIGMHGSFNSVPWLRGTKPANQSLKLSNRCHMTGMLRIHLNSDHFPGVVFLLLMLSSAAVTDRNQCLLVMKRTWMCDRRSITIPQLDLCKSNDSPSFSPPTQLQGYYCCRLLPIVYERSCQNQKWIQITAPPVAMYWKTFVFWPNSITFHTDFIVQLWNALRRTKGRIFKNHLEIRGWGR